MDEDIDDIFRRQAAEDPRRQAEQQQYEETRKKWDAVNALLLQIEHPSINQLRGESEIHAWYADLLIQYCRAVREADLAAALPNLTPATDGTRLGLAVVRYAWVGNSKDIVSILHRAEGVKNRWLGAGMVGAIIDLLHRLRGTRGPTSGGWAEADSADAGTAEGIGTDLSQIEAGEIDGGEAAGAGRSLAEGEQTEGMPGEDPWFDLRARFPTDPAYIEVLRTQLSSEEATDLDRITHFACVFFHRPRFTGDIFERLDPWLRLRVPGVDLWELTLKQVADLLEEAAAPKGTARTGADGAQVEAKRGEGVGTLDDSAAGRDEASYPSPCSRPAGPIERVEPMSSLPHLGDFDFLRSCTPTTEQMEELTPLAERWQALVDRWGVPGTPGAFQPPPEDGIAFHNEYVPLYNALHVFGARHGFIAESEQGALCDPVAEIREAIRHERLIVNLLRHELADFQIGINKLWDLWRSRLPEHAPPQWPSEVVNAQLAHEAIDTIQRELNRLYPPVVSLPASTHIEPEEEPVVSDDSSHTEIGPYLLRCVRELREAMRPCLSQRDAIAYQHYAGIWYRQLELCLRDLRAGGRKFRGTSTIRRALTDLQTYFDYRNDRAESRTDPDAETDARFQKRFRKALKRLERELEDRLVSLPSGEGSIEVSGADIMPTEAEQAERAANDSDAAEVQRVEDAGALSWQARPIEKGSSMSAEVEAIRSLPELREWLKVRLRWLRDWHMAPEDPKPIPPAFLNAIISLYGESLYPPPNDFAKMHEWANQMIMRFSIHTIHEVHDWLETHDVFGAPDCPSLDPIRDERILVSTLEHLSRLLNFIGVRAGERSTPASQAESEQAEGIAQRKRKRRGGKRRLEVRNPLLFQVYDHIRREHRPGEAHRDTIDRLKGDKQFVEQIKEAGKKPNSALVKNALDFFDRRQRRSLTDNRQSKSH